jgi:hypothetical protein
MLWSNAHETDETSQNHLDFAVLFLVMRKMISTVTTAG